jgi:hypothetical protein
MPQLEVPEGPLFPPIMPEEQSSPQSHALPLPQEYLSAPVFIIPHVTVFPVPRTQVPPVVFIALKGESEEAAKTPAGIRNAARRARTNNFDME